MAGRRLASVGVLAAAMTAAAALWVTQHAPLPSSLRGIRQAHAVITTTVAAHMRAPMAAPTPQPTRQVPLGLPVTALILLGLVPVGTALRRRAAAAPVTARPPRRGRAPPSPTSEQRTARIRVR
ncbi:hypothetical protein ACNTMW_04690 [Planosporangium sp. 12N6]|uniref:hypothetical protein n=1 Tax=Planosporangium spinosum TaxID=3402278 RepID=UPI003CFAD902